MKLNEEQINKLKYECDTCFIDMGKLCKISDNYKKLEQGSFAQCYTDFNSILLKKYFANPHLDSSETGQVIYTYKDVVDNLINIYKIKQEDSAIPIKFYVVDNDLKMYKEPFMKGDKLEAIKDKDLSEIKSAWYYAYYLARFYADKNITMYDLNPNNCNIYDGRLLIYDLDFYKEENNKDLALINNYEIVNTCFANFFEDYYFDFNYKTNLKDYYKTKFCDDFFDEFYDNTKSNCKTLKEAYKKMHL